MCIWHGQSRAKTPPTPYPLFFRCLVPFTLRGPNQCSLLQKEPLPQQHESHYYLIRNLFKHLCFPVFLIGSPFESVWRQYLVVHVGEGMLLAFGGQRPGVLLKFLGSIGQAHNRESFSPLMSRLRIAGPYREERKREGKRTVSRSCKEGKHVFSYCVRTDLEQIFRLTTLCFL